MSISNLTTSTAFYGDLSVNTVTTNEMTTADIEATANLTIPRVNALGAPAVGKLATLNAPPNYELYYSTPTEWRRISSDNNYVGTSNGAVITATTTESSLMPATGIGSLSVPADSFQVGDVYHIVISGSLNSQNGNTLTIRWKTNGNTAMTIIVGLDGATNEFFELEGDFIIRAIGGAGIASIASNFEFTYSDAPNSTYRGDRICAVNSTNFDTTINNTLDITVQFNTNSASNRIQSQICYLKHVIGF